MVLIDSLAEIRSKIEQDVLAVMVCLEDSDNKVRLSALDAIGSFVQYRE
jgi:hypothetical protein